MDETILLKWVVSSFFNDIVFFIGLFGNTADMHRL